MLLYLGINSYYLPICVFESEKNVFLENMIYVHTFKVVCTHHSDKMKVLTELSPFSDINVSSTACNVKPENI